jgi:hypothetical protein
MIISLLGFKVLFIHAKGIDFEISEIHCKFSPTPTSAKGGIPGLHYGSLFNSLLVQFKILGFSAVSLFIRGIYFLNNILLLFTVLEEAGTS